MPLDSYAIVFAVENLTASLFSLEQFLPFHFLRISIYCIETIILCAYNERRKWMGKTYDELDFTDDFLFCHILIKNEELCKELAELITNRKIRRILSAEGQKTRIFQNAADIIRG